MNFIALMLILPLSFQGDKSSEVIGVCKLLSSYQQYDGKEIVVEGYLEAGDHLTTFNGDGCSRSIELRFHGQTPAEFSKTLAKKRLGLESRRFTATLRGKFTAKVCKQGRCKSRIDIQSIESYKLE